MSGSEEIVKTTYGALEAFLENTLDAESFHHFISQRKILFPSWEHLWNKLKPWLEQYVVCDMHSTILGLAQLLPTTPSFHHNLQNSLALHDTFWNQVYLNLIQAKQRLPC